MRTTGRILKPSHDEMSASGQLPLTDEQGKEEEFQAEEEVWEQHVHLDALSEASKKSGSLVLGNAEVQMKKLSERMTREAQEERQKRLSQAQEEEVTAYS